MAQFTRKLTLDEQRALPADQIEAYLDFHMGLPVKRRPSSDYLSGDYDRVESGMLRADLGA